MKKNTGAKIFIWMIIILMTLALTISFLLPILSPFFQDEVSQTSQQINIQDLITDGKVTLETSTPAPSEAEVISDESTEEGEAPEGIVNPSVDEGTEETIQEELPQ